MGSVPAPPPALPIALFLYLLLASTATAAPAAPDSHPSSPADSKPGFPKSTAALSGERAAPVMDPVVAAAGESEDEDNAAAEGGHKIQVRDAGPVRFWSGSRYGRSGRSVGGASESQAHGGGRSDGSSFGMAMSLRSSGPVIQPRHDRFFLGSRYGKRGGQGPREEWRRAGEDEEVEEGGEQEEEARTMKEASPPLRALPGDSEEEFGLASQRGSSKLQPTSCIYMGIGNLYRCYEGRREGGVH